MSDASDMLAAALEQMDGIIAGSKALEYSNGIFDCQSPTSPFMGSLRVLHLMEDLCGLLELMEAGEKEGLRCQVPDSTAETLMEWLHSDMTNGHISGNEDLYQERLVRLENDKESLVLQVSVLTDQVEAQGEKIRDLELCLEEHREKLNATEEMLQQELLSRTSLETQKLDLMAEVSNLKLKLTAVEKDRIEFEDRFIDTEGLIQEIKELRLKVSEKENERAQFEKKIKSTKSLMAKLSSMKIRVGQMHYEKQWLEQKCQTLKDELALLKEQREEKEREVKRLQAKLLYKGPEEEEGEVIEKDLEVQKMKKAVESLMAANEEKDQKIEELRQSLNRYKKVQDMVLLAQGKKVKDGGSDDSVNSGSFSALLGSLSELEKMPPPSLLTVAPNSVELNLNAPEEQRSLPAALKMAQKKKGPDLKQFAYVTDDDATGGPSEVPDTPDASKRHFGEEQDQGANGAAPSNHPTWEEFRRWFGDLRREIKEYKQELHQAMEEIREEMAEIGRRTDECDVSLEEHDIRLKALQHNSDQTQADYTALNAKLEDLDNRGRRHNLRFRGIPEDENEVKTKDIPADTKLTPVLQKSSSLDNLKKDTPDTKKEPVPKPREKKTSKEMSTFESLPPKPPGHSGSVDDESFGTRKARSSFGRGFFKIKNTKRTASAPNLAETERGSSERLDAASLSSQTNEPENGQVSPSTPESRKKSRGIKKLFGKLKRSQSTTFNPDDDPETEFRRGGTRATAGPRLGWSRDLGHVKNDLDMPFAKWTKEQVYNWLQAQGLGTYVNNGRQWIVSGQTLLHASQQDLEKELGIKHSLHRKKLQLALQALGSEEESTHGKLDYSWVTRWLDDIGLPQYKTQFDDGKVDGRMLHYMTIDDLLSLKIVSVLHHLSIKRAIQVLRINNFEPNCLRRRPSDENNITPLEVAQWTNHRVMEWLRSVDLAEYAPNLRGSGVHGGLMILEPRFNVETMAQLLNIPPNKTLLRRHLATHFNLLVGHEAQQQKQEALESPDYILLTATAKVKPKKPVFSNFGSLRKKKSDDGEEYVCPMEVGQLSESSSAKGFSRGLDIGMYDEEDLDRIEQMDDSEGTVRQIGAFSAGINNLTHMLKEDEMFKDFTIRSPSTSITDEDSNV
ncbi:liprin-beta-1 [Rhinatrema bivittatum]|uniref:liprin-beta-1 n=1 Tax=Rhinatrema bivittatum TaxID=194408 RepID=UPI001127FEF9|nr:liprin-beta-1 [Rhinatrema bivittatum]